MAAQDVQARSGDVVGGAFVVAGVAGRLAGPQWAGRRTLRPLVGHNAMGYGPGLTPAMPSRRDEQQVGVQREQCRQGLAGDQPVGLGDPYAARRDHDLARQLDTPRLPARLFGRTTVTPEGLSARILFTRTHIPWNEITELVVVRRALGLGLVVVLRRQTGPVPKPRQDQSSSSEWTCSLGTGPGRQHRSWTSVSGGGGARLPR